MPSVRSHRSIVRCRYTSRPAIATVAARSSSLRTGSGYARQFVRGRSPIGRRHGPQNPDSVGSNPTARTMWCRGTSETDVARHRRHWSVGSAGGLGVVLGVEGEASELDAVVGEDSDFEAGDEHDDAPAGVAAADADVVEAAVVAGEGRGAGGG